MATYADDMLLIGDDEEVEGMLNDLLGRYEGREFWLHPMRSSGFIRSIGTTHHP